MKSKDLKKSGAESIFESLNSIGDIQNLINDGESENLYLECKTAGSARLNPEMKNHLASAISGFSNANGGVVIYGVKTEKKSKRKGEGESMDVLIDIEKVGNVDLLMKGMRNAIPSLTIPSVLDFEIKTIKQKNKQSGIVVLLIKKSNSDPLQSTEDNLFYFRSGDEFIKAPYEVIKRLFAATESPDVTSFFFDGIFKIDPNGYWNIPVTLKNNSSAIGENIHISIEILNPNCCEDIKADNPFRDNSNINPEKKIFMANINGVLHKGLDSLVGYLKVKMKKNKIKLDVIISIYSNKMRAKKLDFSLYLNKKKFRVEKKEESYLY